MVQTIELVRGGGGSIKVGTTGTIGSLMTREMESMKITRNTLNRPRRESPANPVSVFCGGAPPKSQPCRNAPGVASSSSSSNSVHKKPETSEKTNRSTKKTIAHSHRKPEHRSPMLSSDGVGKDKKFIRKLPEKKGSCSHSSHRSYIVEVVDVKCNNPDIIWPSPITNRLRKLGFSKLSDTL